MGIRLEHKLSQRPTQTIDQVWNDRWKKHGLYAAAPTAFLRKPECAQYEQQFIECSYDIVLPWLAKTENVRRQYEKSFTRPCILADVPCGGGSISLHPPLLKDLHHLGWNIIGADISQQALLLYEQQCIARQAPATEIVHSDIISLLQKWVTDKFAPEILLISRAIMHIPYDQLVELRELIGLLYRISPWMITIVIGAYADYQRKNHLTKMMWGYRKNEHTWYPKREVLTIAPPASCIEEFQFPYFKSEIYNADLYGVSYIHKTG